MPEDEEAAAQPAQTPCAACRTLRRRCVPSCIFAPYFPAEDDDPSRFAAIHRVFGASNAARMLADVELPDDCRRAAETLVEEAMARIRDPAFGLVSLHAILFMLNQDARAQVSALREEIAREFGADAAAEWVDIAAASPEVKVEAREMVNCALVEARKKDAELLDERRAFNIEWLQRQAARRAGEGRRRVSGGPGQKDTDAEKQMAETEDTAAAGESSTEKTGLPLQVAAAGDEHRHLAALHAGAEPGIPEGNLHKQSAAGEESAREEEEALASESEQAVAAAEVQRHDSATKQLGGEGTRYIDVAAAEELAKKLDTMIQRSAAAQQHDDPAAARYASLVLDVPPPGLQQPPRDMAQEVAEAQQEAAAVEAESDQSLRMMLAQQIAAEAAAAATAAEQGMVIQLLAKQYDVNDTELDITMAYGHPDMHQQTAEAQLVAAAFTAGEVSVEQGLTMPHAAAAVELVRQEMMMQYAHHPGLSQEIVQQLAVEAAPLAMEQDIIMPEVAAAELGREQAMIIHNVATAELASEQALMMQQTKKPEEEMSLLLEAAAALQRPVAAQYSDDISLGHHQPTVQQMLQEQQLAGVAMEPNTTAMQQVAQHGCETVALQTPASGEVAPFLVGQQLPPQGQTATALELQLDSSLLPELGQTTAQVPPQQQSTDGGDEGQDSDFTSILYH